MRSKLELLVIILMVLMSAFSCGERSGQVAQKAGSEGAAIQEIPSVCIWDGASVRSEPSNKSKWLSSMTLGEKIIWSGLIKMDSSDNNREFFKVRLSDGKEGWTQTSLIVTNARPAVVTQKTLIYKRPDLLTISDREFEPMEIVAIAGEKETWLDVVGNERKKSGWLPNTSVSGKDADIAVATLAKKALAEKDPKKMRDKIMDILNNPALAESIFIPELQRQVVPENPPDPEAEDSSASNP